MRKLKKISEFKDFSLPKNDFSNITAGMLGKSKYFCTSSTVSEWNCQDSCATWETDIDGVIVDSTSETTIYGD